MAKKTFILLLLVSLFLSGCSTLRSATPVEMIKAVPIETNEETSLVEAPVSLEEAIDQTQSDLLERFWFRAHVANNIGKRRLTHMTINGIVVRPHGYYMHNSLLANRYEYYRFDDQTFIRQNHNWFRGREPHVPFNIFHGFDEWKPFLEKATVVDEAEVLSVPTSIYQIELTGSELLTLESPILHQLPIKNKEILSPILEETKLKVLFYVGNIDKKTPDKEVLPVIYKFETWVQMPIPGAGYMEQEIQHFIFRVNEPGVEMTTVEEIEKYVIEIDKVQEQYEKEFEEEAPPEKQ